MGDRNTKFFHISTIVCRNKNKIKSLLNEEGCQVTKPNELMKMATEYFYKLYSMEETSQESTFSKATFPQWKPDEIRRLNRPFINDDIRTALFDMSPYKAPGLDGF